MEATRRSFLQGALALSVVAVTPKAFANVPVIYGDGIHDDWAGLQAMLDGKPFRVLDSSAFIAKPGYLKGGSFRISDGLHLRRDFLHVSGARFTATDDFRGDSLVTIWPDSKFSSFTYNYLLTNNLPGVTAITIMPGTEIASHRYVQGAHSGGSMA